MSHIEFIIIEISNLTLILIDRRAFPFKLEHLQRNKRIRVKLIKWKMGNFIKNLFLFWREMKGRHCLICNRVFSNTWDLYWIIVSSISIANDYENFIDNQVEWFWYVKCQTIFKLVLLEIIVAVIVNLFHYTNYILS